MADVKLIGMDDSTDNGTTSYNILMLCKYDAVVTGSATSIRAKMNTAGNIKLALYVDSGGEPGALLAAASPLSAAIGWNAATISSTPIVAGTPYWIAFLIQTPGKLVWTNPNSVAVSRVKNPTTYDGFTFPDPAGSGFTANNSTYRRMLAVWGTEAAAGCPRQAMHMRRLM